MGTIIAGFIGGFLAYFSVFLVNKVLNKDKGSPIISVGAPQGPRLMNRRSGKFVPKANTELKEYEAEKRLEGEIRG